MLKKTGKPKKEVEKKKEEVEKEKEKKVIKKKEKEEKLLVPLEDYIKVAIHLGTRAITPRMRPYVYRRKADGIAVLNTKKIDEKLKIAALFLSQYSPDEIAVCCKRDVGHVALEAFGNATGAGIFKRYHAGSITNPNIENFFEPKILFVIDPWLDKNALKDAVKIHIPIIALCDTNNPTEYIDVVVPCNNKTAVSIGLALYIIAREYLSQRKEKKKINAEDFYQLKPREEKVKKKKEEKVDIKEMIARKMRFKKE